MPFTITDGITTAKADNGFDALRVCMYPAELTSKHIVAMTSGALTGVAAGTANVVAAMRQIDSASVIQIRKIQIGWITTTGFTAAQYMDFGVYVARSYTVSSSGGTAWSGASNNGKLRTSLGLPTNLDARIATTAALTAGTFTADTNPIAQCGCWNAAGAAGGVIPMTILLDQGPGDYPLILAQNEGLIVCPMTAMGAAGVGILTVLVEGCSSTAY
jgi:hypothetical protein